MLETNVARLAFRRTSTCAGPSKSSSEGDRNGDFEEYTRFVWSKSDLTVEYSWPASDSGSFIKAMMS